MNHSHYDIELLDRLGVYACVIERPTLRIVSCTLTLARVAGAREASEMRERVVLDVLSPHSYEDFEYYIRNFDEMQSIICTLGQTGMGAFRAVVSLCSHALEPDATFLTMICMPVRDDRQQIEHLQEEVRLLVGQNERLRDFTSLVAHDLRNPLHVVINGVDLVKAWQGGTLNQRASEQLDSIHRAGVAMNAILNGVMKYFRFEIGEYPMELTDINMVVDGLLATIANTTDKKVDIRRISVLPPIVCEQQLIHELFSNVVNNAVKYSDKEPVKIEIGLESATGSDPVFFVRDNGVGIRAADLPKVFQPFGRADRRGLNTQGMGMGMALVKKIVERHGGGIWLESEVGLGTTVRFSLSGNPIAKH